MKVNSMDAMITQSITLKQDFNTNDNVEYKSAQLPDNAQPAAADSRQQLSEKYVSDAVAKANKAIAGNNRRFEVMVHEKTKTIMVKVVDTDTNEVIREIPPEKILDLVANLMQLAGLIVDERR